jgi:ankyrin repeat protein
MSPNFSSYTFDADANNDGITPLHEAAKVGLLNIVKLLIDAGMNPSAQDKNGRNALHYAAEKGHCEVVELLLTKVDPWFRDAAGVMPLELALENQFYETVKIFKDLFSSAANLVQFAAYVGDVKYMQHLLSTDIDKHVRNADGFTALHLASGRGLIDVVNALLAAGLDPNAKSSRGAVSLRLAVANATRPSTWHLHYSRDHVAVIKALVHAGADVDLRGGFAGGGPGAEIEQITVLHRAVWGFQEGIEMDEIVSALLDVGAHVDARTEPRKMTALHLATKCGYTNIVRLLLRKNPDIDARDYKGLTPLHYSVKKRYVELVSLFLSYNADVSAKNVHGETALHFAVRAGDEEVVRMLLLEKVSGSIKTASQKERNDAQDSADVEVKEERKRRRLA